MTTPATSSDIEVESQIGQTRNKIVRLIFELPWWLIALLIIGVILVIEIRANERFSVIPERILPGLGLTLVISFSSYFFAMIIGLVIGLIRSNPPAPPAPGKGIHGAIVPTLRLVIYQAATLYVSVLRGLPILIVIIIVAFVILPALDTFLESSFGTGLPFPGSSPQSIIAALALTYGAFMSETFRAGIQSIGRGQVEASRSLGMNYLQTMRYIVLPQAIRRILPPLGNDLVAILKDSSLSTLLGVGDISQAARIYSGASFRYLETYLVVSMFYLVLTTIGSLFVRFLERITRFEQH